VRSEFYQAKNCVVSYCVASSYFVYSELIAVRAEPLILDGTPQYVQPSSFLFVGKSVIHHRYW